MLPVSFVVDIKASVSISHLAKPAKLDRYQHGQVLLSSSNYMFFLFVFYDNYSLLRA